jgi:hypothetical protein
MLLLNSNRMLIIVIVLCFIANSVRTFENKSVTNGTISKPSIDLILKINATTTSLICGGPFIDGKSDKQNITWKINNEIISFYRTNKKYRLVGGEQLLFKDTNPFNHDGTYSCSVNYFGN